MLLNKLKRVLYCYTCGYQCIKLAVCWLFCNYFPKTSFWYLIGLDVGLAQWTKSQAGLVDCLEP